VWVWIVFLSPSLIQSIDWSYDSSSDFDDTVIVTMTMKNVQLISNFCVFLIGLWINSFKTNFTFFINVNIDTICSIEYWIWILNYLTDCGPCLSCIIHPSLHYQIIYLCRCNLRTIRLFTPMSGRNNATQLWIK
jgi:hypothetical protein